MAPVSIYAAKRRLAQLVDKAAGGEDVVLSRHGKPVARITRLEPAKRKIRFGLLKGKVTLASDFDAPLPDSVLGGFQGEAALKGLEDISAGRLLDEAALDDLLRPGAKPPAGG
jgi:prevent-host-death family protein